MFTDKINKPGLSGIITPSPFFPSNIIQLQEAGGDNPCRFWNQDTESLAVTVIKKYITEELQWSNVSVDSFTGNQDGKRKCDTWDPDNKHWGCDFVLSNKRKGTVFILEKRNRVKVQLANVGKDGSIWCFYNYTCNDKNEITFTKDNCS